MYVKKISCIGRVNMNKENEGKTIEQQQIEESMKKGKENL